MTLGAGWNTAWDCTPTEYRHRQEELTRACQRHGRDPPDVRRTVGLTTLIGRDAEDIADRWRRLRQWAPAGALNSVSLREWARSRLVGTPAEIRSQLDVWRRLGVEQVVCSFGAPFAVWEDEQLELVSTVLAPA